MGGPGSGRRKGSGRSSVTKPKGKRTWMEGNIKVSNYGKTREMVISGKDFGKLARGGAKITGKRIGKK